MGAPYLQLLGYYRPIGCWSVLGQHKQVLHLFLSQTGMSPYTGITGNHNRIMNVAEFSKCPTHFPSAARHAVLYNLLACISKLHTSQLAGTRPIGLPIIISTQHPQPLNNTSFHQPQSCKVLSQLHTTPYHWLVSNALYTQSHVALLFLVNTPHPAHAVCSTNSSHCGWHTSLGVAMWTWAAAGCTLQAISCEDRLQGIVCTINCEPHTHVPCCRYPQSTIIILH